jgi:hypothetical protein
MSTAPSCEDRASLNCCPQKASGPTLAAGKMFAATCSEFPNDNPALHRGAIWRCLDTSGAATCELPALAGGLDAKARRAVETTEQAGDLTVAEMTVCAGDRGPEADVGEPASDPFVALKRLLGEVASAWGASEEISTGLQGLLGETRLDATRLPVATVEALIAGKHVEQTTDGITRTEVLARTVLAWQGILRGDGDDLAACGRATLDEWAADIVARLLGNPVHAAALRRELRQRGVAAFGLVAQAA